MSTSTRGSGWSSRASTIPSNCPRRSGSQPDGMADPDAPDPRRKAPLGIEAEPPVVGRLATWLERTRLARGRIEAARARHVSVDLGFNVLEHDAAIGGGLLARAPAHPPLLGPPPAS